MYELKQLTKHCYYFESPAKIGLVELGDNRPQEVVLIDSGGDKDAGRKVRQHLDAQNWKLVSIFNTHSNADHVGGNKYLQNQTGCDIYACGIECDFANHPFLEPSFLYGGYPFKDLRHKFLLAQPSTVLPLTSEVLPEGFEIIALPGHFFDMVGFKTPDEVVYLADCLSSKETLDKYQIGFIYDVASYLQTLEMLKGLEAKYFVPAHAPVCESTEELAELAQVNIEKVYEIARTIEAFCKTPLTFESLLQRLFTHYGLTMNFEQYVLAGSTVRSYLSWLKDSGSLGAEFVDNQLFWQSL